MFFTTLGNTNLQIIFFPKPILTTELTFNDFVYTASPQAYKTSAQYDDGHNVLLQMELFGCDNYDLTFGNFSFPFSAPKTSLLINSV